MNTYTGNIVNIFDDSVFFGTLTVHEGRIFDIKKTGEEDPGHSYFLPGFVDAHVHIESSLLPPSQFGRMAVVHGTVATVSDPHEIANVVGTRGVSYMIENGESVPFKFFFGAPSCVPATGFETAGAEVTAQDIDRLLADERVLYLAEMMNFPGVIHQDAGVMEKLAIARRHKKPVDGHAPGLRREQASAYFSAGISTDHECFTLEEAEEKLKLGVKILIREGSAARNFDALIPLAVRHSEQMMFCSDDKHPDELLLGHINLLVKRAVAAGVNRFAAFRMASVNPVRHYNLPVGLLREGELADFIEVDNLDDLHILATYINGEKVAENGKTLIGSKEPELINRFSASPVSEKDLAVQVKPGDTQMRVIRVLDGQLITEKHIAPLSDIGKEDILKMVVYNRYHPAPPAVAYIRGFGLKQGALASSVAHDSHNIVATGTDDKAIAEAINLVVKEKGGLSAVSKDKKMVLPLPIAGLMSAKDGYQVAEEYTRIDRFAREVLECRLRSPFMSLSFMALLVIPSLKLSDKGLFDGDTFEFTAVSF
ncbi:adenine deaminase [Leadbetterella sp. DM7]|uniref:adenine deaminase n=1 Tax=Leadbetterella sp. DM7 TaxID=3235085 RepID=UPI00349E7A7D